jgi:hypothetical protein
MYVVALAVWRWHVFRSQNAQQKSGQKSRAGFNGSLVYSRYELKTFGEKCGASLGQ